MKEELELFYKNHEIDKIENVFKTKKLEQAGNIMSITFKIFDYLENNSNFESIYNIISNISNYKIDVLNDELKEGLKILTKNNQVELCLNFLCNHISLSKNNKKIDEYLTIQVMKICYCSNDELIIKFLNEYKNLSYSHNFWTSVTDGFLKSNNNFVYKVLEIFPLKHNYGEIYWKKITKENLSNFRFLNEILHLKFLNRNNNIEDIKAYENCFNSYLEMFEELYKNKLINLEELKTLFLRTIKTNLNFKESLLENFLVFVALEFNDFEILYYFIILAENFISNTIVEKLINSIYNANFDKDIKMLTIYKIIALCKSKKLVPYETLNLDTSILRDSFLFVVNNIKLNKDKAVLFNDLSQENILYAKSYFNEESIEDDKSKAN